VAALNAAPIGALEGFYLATLGGARALDLDDRIGSLRAGREADLVVLDPDATPLLAFRNARSRSIERLASICGGRASAHPVTVVSANGAASARSSTRPGSSC